MLCLAVVQRSALAFAASVDQSLQLSCGWNAVWLEVGPVDGGQRPVKYQLYPTAPCARRG